MIRMNQVRMPLGHSEKELKARAARILKTPVQKICKLNIVRQSVDARKKPNIRYSYVLDVSLGSAREEERLLKKLNNRDLSIAPETIYRLPDPGTGSLKHRPVVVGSGPAGLFCALMLARKGYNPLVLERGADVDARTEAVESFWRGGPLDPESNVQFGEGGAGTFSDGKLNTLVRDVSGRNQEVLRLFAEFGADPSICYAARPHLGTDVLRGVVKAMRGEIIRLGGEVRFHSRVTDFIIEEGLERRLTGVVVNQELVIDAQAVVLAVGHSARDTFAVLHGRGVPMEAKAFAVGLRIQHPQSMINKAQYGVEECRELGPASYKLTGRTSSGRGVYSFCMCPGGYVVNASSEQGRVAVNGMSYHARAGENANSAIIVSVTPGDYPDSSPLSGVAFQRRLEEEAFAQGGGRVPVQLYGDFKEDRRSQAMGEVKPAVKGGYELANLRQALPGELSLSLIEGIEGFDRQIPGFARGDALLAGIESRTSSPVRIPRDENMECAVRGLFPCGEGAGYAGGITSAAMDGIRAAEEIIQRYGRGE